MRTKRGRVTAAAALVAIAAATILLLSTGASGAGCTKTWNGVSGSWQTPTDWTPSGVPGSSDDVCIPASGSYSVTASGSISVASLSVGGASGAQTLLLVPGTSLSVTAGAQIEASGTVTLEGENGGSGTRLHSGSSTLTNAGTLNLGVGTPTTSTIELTGDVTSTGTIHDNTDAIFAGGTLDNEGPLKIASGVTLEDDNTTVVDDAGGAIEASGSGKLTTSGNGAVYEQGDGTTSGSEPVVVGGGAVHYIGGGHSSVVEINSFQLSGNIASGQALTVRGAADGQASASYTSAGTITLEATSPSSATLQVTGGGTLTNTGTITMVASGAGFEPKISANLVNEGTLAVESDSVFTGGTLDNKGPLKIANGVRLEDGDSTVVDDAGGEIDATGSGRLTTSGDFAVYEQGDGTTSGSEPVVVGGGAVHYVGVGHSSVVEINSFQLQGNIASGQSLTVRGASDGQASASYTSAGTITLEATSPSSATLQVTGGGTLTNTGTIAMVASGAGFEPKISANLVNEGTLAVESNSVYTGGTLDNKGPLKIANGVRLEDGDSTVADDVGGAIEATGTGTLTSSGDFAVYEQGEGTTSGSEPVVLAGAALHYTGHGHSSIVETNSFQMQGNLAAEQSLAVRGQSGLQETGGFTNAGTIALDATQGDPTLHVSGGTLANSGTLTASAAGATVHEAEITGSVTNTGTVNFDVKTAYAGAAAVFDNKGTVNIADGVTFNDAQTVIDDEHGALDAEGSGRLLTSSNNGVYDQGEGTTSGTEPVLISGAALDYTGHGQSSIFVSGSPQIQGNLASAQVLTMIEGGTINAHESFTNAGRIAVNSTNPSSGIRLNGNTLDNAGTLVVRSPGVPPNGWEVVGAVANTGTLEVQASSNFGALTNSGTVLVAEGQTLKAQSFKQTAGATQLAGTSGHVATLAASTAAIEGGALEGDGTVAGNLLNEGTVAPGAPVPGTIAVQGAYTQGLDGTLAVEVADAGAATLSVTGSATLGGTLAVSTTGFGPTVGQQYAPLAAASRSGEFATVTGLSSGPYELLYTASGVELLTLASTPPALSVQGETKRNPDAGDGTATFTVTLSEASSHTVSVKYATADGVARAPSDYEARNGTLSFAPGETQKTVPVTVHGTSEPTADRTLYLNLSEPKGATITQAQGTADIRNDHVAVTRATPAEGGQGGRVTLTLEGAGFSGTPTVTLARAGQPNVVASDVKADPTAHTLTATVDLAEAAEGTYDVVVSLPAFSASATLPAAFKVTAPWAAEVETELIGFPADSTGEPWTGELLYTNTGTLDAHNTILAIEGFQTGAEVKVSGSNVVGTTFQDSGSSRTVLVEISEVPAQSTEAAFVTFTPVGDNGSEYSLQPFTVLSNDETFSPPADDPSVTTSNEVTGESENSLKGVVHLKSSTGGGDVRYSIEASEVPAAEAAGRAPRIVETTLENGEVRDELEATLPAPATGPPPFEPSVLLSPGPFSICGPVAAPPSPFFGPGVLSAVGCLGVQEIGEGGEEGGEEGAEEGGAEEAVRRLPSGARAPRLAHASRVTPAGKVGEVVKVLKTIVESGKKAKEKWEALQQIKKEITNAKHNEAAEKHTTECLKEHGYLSEGQAQTALNLAEGASSLTQFEALANQVGFSGAINNNASPKALELFNSVVQSAWGEALFGGGFGGNTGSLTGTNSSGPFAGLNTPAERLQKALELCPPEPEPEPEPKKEPEPKPKPKPKHKKGPKKRRPPHRLKVRNSHDPNELVGPEGYGAGNYIAPEGPLTYEALFTNEATAGAAAREVRLSDQLDPSKLDLATFSFGPIFFGSTVAAPPPGLQKWTTTVDLRPTKDLLVEIEAELDTHTGLVTWNLQAIDPATGKPPIDPSDGFLPPNAVPPEGVGGASFTVQPDAGLTTGEVIADKATIVFDQNTPIETAPWLNTIDTSTPSSHIAAVAAAPPGGNCGNLGVSWTGTDTGAGIDHYEIYVSKNGGPFEIWQPMTAATGAVFPGALGTTYSFSSAATDGVLHSETPPGAPSAPVTAACAANGGTGSGPAKGPTAGVRISNLSFAPAKFAVGKAATAVSARRRSRGTRAHVGTTIGYDLSATGDVSIAIERNVPGLKLTGHGCVVQSAATRRRLLASAERSLKRDSAAQRRHRLAALLHAARCTAKRTEGTLKRAGRAGANRVAFSGRIGSRALSAGGYLAQATVGPATSPPTSAEASFQVVSAAGGRR